MQAARSRLHFFAALKLREGIRGSFFEAGEAAAENEFDLVGGAIALFGDKDVGHVALFGGSVEIEEIGAVDEHDDVGVLFDGARFAEVRELRATLVAFRRAGELTKNEYGNLQFLGEAFKATGNAGDFFLARIETTASGDELEIIDYEKRETFVAFETARFCTDFENAGGAGVVHPKRSGRNGAERVSHAAPIFAAEMAGTEFVRVNLSDRGDETLQQRFLGHFKAEDGYGQATTNGDIFGEVKSEGGLTLRRAGGENDEFGRLQAGKKLVEFTITGGYAGDAFAFAEDFLEAFEIIANDVFDGNETGFDAIFGESKNLRFGAVEDDVGALFGIERFLLDFLRSVRQPAQHGFFSDDARVVRHVGDARNPIDERGKVRRAARGFEFAAAMQFFAKRDEVNGLLGFAKRNHLIKHALMLRQEKIFGLERLDGGVEGIIVEQDGAEDGALSVEIARQWPFECSVARHSETKNKPGSVRLFFANYGTGCFSGQVRMSLRAHCVNFVRLLGVHRSS